MERGWNGNRIEEWLEHGMECDAEAEKDLKNLIGGLTVIIVRRGKEVGAKKKLGLETDGGKMPIQ
jgi:hypothetical protein